MRPLTERERRWMKQYVPCDNGVHVFNPDDDEFGGITVANFPGADLTVFRALSSAGDGDDYDLICDYYVDTYLVDNVMIRRQDLAVIQRALCQPAENFA